MVTCTQLPAPISGQSFLSLPVREKKKRFFFFVFSGQLSESCGCTIAALPNDINQCQSTFSPLKCHANVRPLCTPSQFNVGASPLITLIILTCIGTQLGGSGLCSESRTSIGGEAERMPSRIQSGETGRNWQRLEGTGQSSSVVRPASAFFWCQTVFWQRRYPHICTGLRETGISSRYCTEEEGKKKKEKNSISLMFLQPPNF